MHQLNYIPAKIHETKRDFYIDWYIYATEFENPRQRVRLNRINPKRRMQFAEKLCAEIDHYLGKGEDPWELIPFLNKRKQAFSSLNGITISKIKYIDGFNSYYSLLAKQNSRKDTLRSYKSLFKLFTDWIDTHGEIVYIHQINKKHAQRFLDYLLFEKNYARKSHENMLTTLRSVWKKFFIPRDHSFINPFEQIEQLKNKGGSPAAKKRVFTIKEMKRIKEYIILNNPAFWAVAGADYYCFIRRTEITKLKMKHFDFERRCIMVGSDIAKDWTDRIVKLPDEYFSFLISQGYHNYNGELFFTSYSNFMPGEKQISATRITEQMRFFLNALEIDKSMSFYDLKRSGLYYFRERGGNKEAAKFQAGHNSDEMHYTYYKPSIKRLDEFNAMSIDDL